MLAGIIATLREAAGLAEAFFLREVSIPFPQKCPSPFPRFSQNQPCCPVRATSASRRFTRAALVWAVSECGGLFLATAAAWGFSGSHRALAPVLISDSGRCREWPVPPARPLARSSCASPFEGTCRAKPRHRIATLNPALDVLHSPVVVPPLG